MTGKKLIEMSLASVVLNLSTVAVMAMFGIFPPSEVLVPMLLTLWFVSMCVMVGWDSWR